MKQVSKMLAVAGAVLAGLGLAVPQARAQSEYPNQPVRMIVPYAPGGASDFLARVIQPRMTALLGQQVIVENRSGGGGNVGMDAAARAPADGYTIFFGEIASVELNPHFYPDLRVKPMQDFEPVSMVGQTPILLVANPKFPPANAKEFVELIKKNPGKYNYASSGAATLDRLVMEQFIKLAGLKMNHVPYSGGAGPATADVVAGHLPVLFATIPSVLPFVQSGRLKAYVISTAERAAALPDVPTVAEVGYPGATSLSWQGVLVPTGTPKPIIDKLHAVLVQLLGEPEIITRMAERGVKAAPSKSPAEFRQFIVEDEKRWVEVIRAVGAKAE